MTLLTLLYTPTLPPSTGGSGGTTPDIADISAILHQRLNAGGGNTAVVFNTTTSPTAAQVLTLIDLYAPLILVEFGDLSDAALTCTSADSIRAAVRALIAAQVAKVIEMSYWPQDTVGGDTAGAYWGELIDRQLPRVVAAARECRLGEVVPGGDGDAGGGVAIKPRWQFNVGLRAGDRAY